VTLSPLRHQNNVTKNFQFGPFQIKISGYVSGLGLIIWWSFKEAVSVLKKWSWSDRSCNLMVLLHHCNDPLIAAQCCFLCAFNMSVIERAFLAIKNRLCSVRCFKRLPKLILRLCDVISCYPKPLLFLSKSAWLDFVKSQAENTSFIFLEELKQVFGAIGGMPIRWPAYFPLGFSTSIYNKIFWCSV